METLSGDTQGRSSLVPRAFIALASLSLLACWPGIGGTWVYDDLHMVDNALYDDFQGVFRVFTRTSADYLGTHELAGHAATYRPVTMATLVATHALIPKPWAHHLVSWALHLLTAWLLYRALVPRPGSGTGIGVVVGFSLAALFVLHPANVESYVWINGRSDLVAGALLAALAVARPGRVQVSKSIVLMWVILCFAGAAAKLPFVVAAGFLWLGSTLRTAPEHRVPGAVALGLAFMCGVAGYVALRALYAPLGASFASGTNVLEDPSLWAFIPRLASMATETLVSLRSEVMQSLAWSASRPPSSGELIGALLLLLGLSALMARRDWGGLAYVAGAIFTLAPAAIITRALWLGFDRYLYMPMILTLLAVAPYLESLLRRARPHRRLAVIAGSAILLVAGVNTRLASAAYRSHEAFVHALISERPNDPTVHLFVARALLRKGRQDLAAQALQSMPGPPWPKAAIIPQLVLAEQLDDPAAFERAIAYGISEYADDPLICAHAMRWHHQAGRLSLALDLARSFPAEHALCLEVRRQLLVWARSGDEQERDRVLEVARDLQCEDHSSLAQLPDRRRR